MKNTRVIVTLFMLVSAMAQAAVVVHSTGTATYSQNLGNGSEVIVEDGEATFTGRIGRSSSVTVEGGVGTFTNTIQRLSSIEVLGGVANFQGNINRSATISITGGIAKFTGTIQRNPTLNFSGGSIELATVGNNAVFDLSGNAQVNLLGSVGRNTSINIQDSAQLTISAANMFDSISELTTNGGFINLNNYDFTVDESILSGVTVVDLGGGTNVVDLGTLSGAGQLIFTNYDSTTEVYFDAFGGFDPGSQLIFDGSSSLVFDGYVTPVPEPEMASLFMLICAGAFAYVRKQRLSKK